jgi:hypothetical protein
MQFQTGCSGQGCNTRAAFEQSQVAPLPVKPALSFRPDWTQVNSYFLVQFF